MHEQLPLVSVVIPAYNYAHFLAECIESALAQTYSAVEVIVVDDGSDDHTAEVVRKYPTVHYVYQSRNGNGGARALNRGIQEAKGAYIAWLSADDRFVPEKLEKQVRALISAQVEDPTVCLVHSDVVYEACDFEGLQYCPYPLEEQQRLLESQGYVRWPGNLAHVPHDQILATFLRHNVVNGCTTLVDRRMLDAVGPFDEAMPRTGDVEMWTRLLATGYRFGFVPEPLVISRCHATNTATWSEVPAEYNLTRRKLRERYPLERLYPSLLNSYGSEHHPHFVKAAHIALGEACLANGLFDGALAEFTLAGLSDADPRVASARSNLPPVITPHPLSIPSEKTTHVVMAFDERSDSARCHLVLSQYLRTFDASSDIALIVWLPDTQSALKAFERRFQAVCIALGIDPEVDPHAEIVVLINPESEASTTYLTNLFSSCHAFLPTATPYDSLLFELASRFNLPAIYETDVDSFRRAVQRANPHAIDIVMLSHNRLEYLKRTIDALYERTRHPFRLIVVDNASEPEVRRYLVENRSHFHRVIFNQENGWTEAFTTGIASTRSNPFVVTDPDIIVPEVEPCWLARMLELMDAHREMGMLALNLDPINKPAKMPDVYLGDKEPYGSEIVLSNVGTVMQMIRRELFEPPYKTDWETVEAIRWRGGLVGFAKNLKAYHLGWDEDKDYPEHLVKKFRYFNQRYGSEVYQLYTEDSSLLKAMEQPPEPHDESNYYAFSRPEVQALVPPEARRILDVGCAAGALGRALKARQACHVTGIEYVPEVASKARRYLDDVLVGDAVAAMAGMPSAQFDSIIFADVLEHLIEPERCLEQARRLLAPGGQIVASIPNVRHWSVVKDLLEGRWDYQDAGILDRTHLRFYTRESMLRQIQHAGFHVTGLSGTVIQGHEVPSGLSATLAHYGIDTASLDTEGQVYQFLLTATATPDRDPSKLTSIVLLGYNQIAFTKLCVESVLANTDAPFELILVDNGSTDGTRDYFQALAEQDPRVKLILNAENLGFALGCNQGIALAQGEYVLFLNNDTIVPKGWLGRMLAHFDLDSQIGAVGAVSNCVSGPQQLNCIPFANHPSAYADMLAFSEQRAQQFAGKGYDLARLVGFCLLVRRDVLDRIGGFDPQFGIGNFEDDDLCLRIRTAGYRTWVAEDVYIHHFGSRTFAALGAHVFEDTMDEGWERFKAKWNLAPSLDRRQPYRVNIPRFDEKRHFVPLPALQDPEFFGQREVFQPGVHPMELAERREVAFFHHPDWSGAAWQDVVTAYVQAFSADDEVSLVLWLDPVQQVSLEDASQLLLDLLASRGVDPEHTPDLVLVPDVLDIASLASLYAGVDCVVPAGDSVQEKRARQMGVKTLPELSIENWQEILRHYREGLTIEA